MEMMGLVMFWVAMVALVWVSLRDDDWMYK